MNIIPVSMVGEVMNVRKSDNSNLYVGLCGTQFVGSDCYAVVITEIISPKAVRIADMTDNDYDNNRLVDENGNEYLKDMKNYARVNKERTSIIPIGKVFKLRKNGRWIQEGNSLWATGGVHFGKAEEYRDPSF